MNEITFSIIVPVYNCERYIEACLMSILRQTYSNYELIVVDDGSTDQSARIAQIAIKSRENCRLIKSLHGGVCKARNTGLGSARGNYICFVDADDILFEDYLQSLASVAEKFKPDAMYFYAKYGIDSGNRKEYPDNIIQNLSLNDIELLSRASLYHIPELYMDESNLKNISSFSSWGQVYRHEIYCKNHILFEDGLSLSEDGLVNLEMLHYVKSAVVIQKELYNYRTDNTSATRSYKPNLMEMFRKRDEKVKAVIERLYSDKKEEYMKQYYCSLIYQLRVVAENSIFHPQNKVHLIEKKKQFNSLTKLPDYSHAIAECTNFYLRPEDKQFLICVHQEAPGKIAANIKKQQLLRWLRSTVKTGIKILHIDGIVLAIWRKIRK